MTRVHAHKVLVHEALETYCLGKVHGKIEKDKAIQSQIENFNQSRSLERVRIG